MCVSVGVSVKLLQFFSFINTCAIPRNLSFYIWHFD